MDVGDAVSLTLKPAAAEFEPATPYDDILRSLEVQRFSAPFQSADGWPEDSYLTMRRFFTWLFRSPAKMPEPESSDPAMGPSHRLYGRFTEPARRVLQLADEDARGRNHEYVGTEHLLLGLVKHGRGAGAETLKSLGVDLLQLGRAVERQLQSGPSPVGPGRVSLTPRSKRVIEFSLEEAERFGHNYVGTEHLLLGLLREEQGLAAQALAERQLTLEKLRAAVVMVLGSNRTSQD